MGRNPNNMIDERLPRVSTSDPDGEGGIVTFGAVVPLWYKATLNKIRTKAKGKRLRRGSHNRFNAAIKKMRHDPIWDIHVSAVDASDIIKLCRGDHSRKKYEAYRNLSMYARATLHYAFVHSKETGRMVDAPPKSAITNELPEPFETDDDLPPIVQPRFMPDMMSRLVDRLRVGRTNAATLSVIFTILTGARGIEVRGLRWREIDLNSRVWRLPAFEEFELKGEKVTNQRSKNMGNVGRPLSDAAIEALMAVPGDRCPEDLVF